MGFPHLANARVRRIYPLLATRLDPKWVSKLQNLEGACTLAVRPKPNVFLITTYSLTSRFTLTVTVTTACVPGDRKGADF